MLQNIFADLPTLNTGRLTLRSTETARGLRALGSMRRSPAARQILREALAPELPGRSAVAVMEHLGNHQLMPWIMEATGTHNTVALCMYVWNIPHSRAEICLGMMDHAPLDDLLDDLIGAVRAVVDFGFEGMQLNRIETRTVEGDTRLQKIVAGAGLRHEALLRDHLLVGQEVYSLGLHAILRHEWDLSYLRGPR